MHMHTCAVPQHTHCAWLGNGWATLAVRALMHDTAEHCNACRWRLPGVRDCMHARARTPRMTSVAACLDDDHDGRPGVHAQRDDALQHSPDLVLKLLVLQVYTWCGFAAGRDTQTGWSGVTKAWASMHGTRLWQAAQAMPPCNVYACVMCGWGKGGVGGCCALTRRVGWPLRPLLRTLHARAWLEHHFHHRLLGVLLLDLGLPRAIHGCQHTAAVLHPLCRAVGPAEHAAFTNQRPAQAGKDIATAVKADLRG